MDKQKVEKKMLLFQNINNMISQSSLGKPIGIHDFQQRNKSTNNIQKFMKTKKLERSN
jgi:hypothetical protein